MYDDVRPHFIYSAGNIGVFFLYRRERPAEFSPVLHFLFPLLSTLSLVWVAYKSIVPLPDAPIRYAPFLVGGWLLGGLVVLLTVPPSRQYAASSSGPCGLMTEAADEADWDDAPPGMMRGTPFMALRPHPGSRHE